METIILIVVIIIELLKYGVGLNLFFKRNIKKKWIAVIGVLGYFVIIITGKIEMNELYLVMYAMVLITFYFMLEAKWKERIWMISAVLIVFLCSDELFGILIESLYNSYNGIIEIEDMNYLSSSLMTLIVVVFIKYLKEKTLIFSSGRLQEFLRRNVFILVLILGIFLSFTIGGLNYSKSYVNNEKFSALANIVSMISFLSILLLGIFIAYIKTVNEKMEKLIDTERKLNEMQLTYYKQMLEREEDTRRYRHDMNNHLICLSELLKVENQLQAIEYMEQIKMQLCTIQQKVYMVGNEIMDAILNYHLHQLDEDVKINVVGRCNGELEISHIDLCTVFSNLIQNAIEELKKESADNKYLNINIKQSDEYFKLVIENSISSNMSINKKRLQTDKIDKRNHGFGLGNVKKALEKNGGILEIKLEMDKYVVISILKSSQIKDASGL